LRINAASAEKKARDLNHGPCSGLLPCGRMRTARPRRG